MSEEEEPCHKNIPFKSTDDIVSDVKVFGQLMPALKADNRPSDFPVPLQATYSHGGELVGPLASLTTNHPVMRIELLGTIEDTRTHEGHQIEHSRDELEVQLVKVKKERTELRYFYEQMRQKDAKIEHLESEIEVKKHHEEELKTQLVKMDRETQRIKHKQKEEIEDLQNQLRKKDKEVEEYKNKVHQKERETREIREQVETMKILKAEVMVELEKTKKKNADMSTTTAGMVTASLVTSRK